MPEPLRLARLWLTIGYALITLVVFQSLNHDPLQIPVAEGNLVGHLGAYATLMLWFGQIHLSRGRRAAWALGFIALGVLLEFAQGQTTYRSFDTSDMAANAAGVALGALLSPPRVPRLLASLDAALCSRLGLRRRPR